MRGNRPAGAPGAALDELQLCDTYGLSRTPLREVFQRLAGCCTGKQITQ